MVKKNELQAIKTLTQIRKFEISILQADQAYVDMRERETVCDSVCVSVHEGGCEREGKGGQGIFGNIKKGGGAWKATGNDCLF